MLAAIALAVLTSAIAGILRKKLLGNGDKLVHILVRGGNEFFGLTVVAGDDAHDIEAFLLAFVLTALTVAAAAAVGKYGIFIALVIEVRDNVKLELVAVVIGEYDKISFFVHGDDLLS